MYKVQCTNTKGDKWFQIYPTLYEAEQGLKRIQDYGYFGKIISLNDPQLSFLEDLGG